MKKLALSLIALWPALWMSAQTSSIPAVELRNIDGKIVSSTEITQAGSPTLLVFWKSSSGKCCENLDQLQETWEDSLKHLGIKMVAICVDCNGAWTQVKPIVNGNDWNFDTYIDVNGDFKRAMNVGDLPCSMIFDSEQNLVCRMNTACTGSEEYICASVINHLNMAFTAENTKK